MPERNIKVTLAYDGTDFLGWQLQKKGRTVQGVMQDGLARMHGLTAPLNERLVHLVHRVEETGKYLSRQEFLEEVGQF